MSTKDFQTFWQENFLTGAGFRNTVLFPEKINGLYAALERPNTTGDIWFTQSQDLNSWGNHEAVLKSPLSIWSTGKIGPCGTPIKTARGWLIIFHISTDNL